MGVDLFRRDVSQADIAPFMALLIGLNWPVNSICMLPNVDPTRPSFLKPRGGEEALAHVAFANTQVLLGHYRIKHASGAPIPNEVCSSFQEFKQGYALFYEPHGPLEGMGDSGTPPRIQKLVSIEQSLREGQWNEVRLK